MEIPGRSLLLGLGSCLDVIPTWRLILGITDGLVDPGIGRWYPSWIDRWRIEMWRIEMWRVEMRRVEPLRLEPSRFPEYILPRTAYRHREGRANGETDRCEKCESCVVRVQRLHLK